MAALGFLPYPRPMMEPTDRVGDLNPKGLDLRIGQPERDSAQEALDTHLADKRIDSTEYKQRRAACKMARTQAELLQVFADLPAPHPKLPGLPKQPSKSNEDDEPSAIVMAIIVTLLLGLPVTVVLGFVYGTWWALTVPVVLSIFMIMAEGWHNRGGKRTDP